MSRYLMPVASFALGLVAGYAVGYFLTKKSAEDRAEADIQSVKEHYATKVVKPSVDYQTINQTLQSKYGSALDRLGYSGSVEELTEMMETNPQAQAIITSLIGMDQEDEIEQTPEEQSLQKRIDRFRDLTDKRSNNSTEPYVISVEEFNEEVDNEKISLVYYVADQTLCNERDEIIADVIRTLGPDALDNFGVGSDDDEIVYIRNDREGLDFEVVRNMSSYVEVVLGEPAFDVGPGKMSEDSA